MPELEFFVCDATQLPNTRWRVEFCYNIRRLSYKFQPFTIWIFIMSEKQVPTNEKKSWNFCLFVSFENEKLVFYSAVHGNEIFPLFQAQAKNNIILINIFWKIQILGFHSLDILCFNKEKWWKKLCVSSSSWG